jgi:hypothetical protein
MDMEAQRKTYGTPPPVVYESSEAGFAEFWSSSCGPVNKSKEKPVVLLTAFPKSRAFTDVASKPEAAMAASDKGEVTIIAKE